MNDEAGNRTLEHLMATYVSMPVEPPTIEEILRRRLSPLDDGDNDGQGSASGA